MTTRTKRRITADVGIGVALVVLQVALFFSMRATSSSADDPFDSSLFWYSWIIFPAVAFIASYVRPDGPRPVIWTGALILPFVVEVALSGTVWHSADDGASLWLVGELFVFALGGLTFALAKSGASSALGRRATGDRPPPPPPPPHSVATP